MSDGEVTDEGPERDEAAAVYRLQSAVTRLARMMRQEVQVTLTPSQASALATIRNHGPITLGDLAERERVAPPSITRMVSRLEAAGYVERATDPADGRVCRVAVTGEAEEMISEARRRKADWLVHRIDDLADEERLALLGAVDAMETLAELR